MSKSTMLRTRRKDINIKPNRRLDRKSSRGMIYENEELRLRTININAEVEKGQSDIKKLRRENEQLRREIWCLRDEYEKLDKLLQEKTSDESSSSSGNSSDEDSEESSCHSAGNRSEETNQNHENVEKITNRHNLHVEFDHLSVVSEEVGGEKQEENFFFQDTNLLTGIPNNQNMTPVEDNVILGPDQSYPCTYAPPAPSEEENQQQPRHFFAPLPNRHHGDVEYPKQTPLFYDKTGVDLFVNQISVANANTLNKQKQLSVHSKFKTGGNLEELLQDIEVISNDILNFSQQPKCDGFDQQTQLNTNTNANSFLLCQMPSKTDDYQQFVKIDESVSSKSTPPIRDDEPTYENVQKPYKSEINVVLMPNPMPLIGFEKYKLLQHSNPEISAGQQYNEEFGPPKHTFNGSQTLLNQSTDVQNCSFCKSLSLNTNTSHIPCPNCLRFNPNLTESQVVQMPLNSQRSPEIIDTLRPPQSCNRKLSIPAPINTATPNPDLMCASTEINSPKIISENFPTVSDVSKILKTIDDSNVEKLTSSSDDKTSKPAPNEIPKSPSKIRKTRKLSIHFNGTKKINDKLNRSVSLDSSPAPSMFENKLTDSTASSIPIPKFDLINIPENREIGSSTNDIAATPNITSKSPHFDRKMSLASNTSSLDKKHVKIDGQKNALTLNDKKHKTHDALKKRRKNSTADKVGSKGRLDQKSNSFDIPRTRHDWNNRHYDSFNEFTSLSERERTNSLTSESSRNTSRKLSTLSQFNNSGKVPWCGCWGNGCL